MPINQYRRRDVVTPLGGAAAMRFPTGEKLHPQGGRPSGEIHGVAGSDLSSSDERQTIAFEQFASLVFRELTISRFEF
jgi:hypothetical protein